MRDACQLDLAWCYAQLLSHVQLFSTPWTAALQVPLSMGFSGQEYSSRLPFPAPGDLPDPGIEPASSALTGRFLTTEAPGSFYNTKGVIQRLGFYLLSRSWNLTLPFRDSSLKEDNEWFSNPSLLPREPVSSLGSTSNNINYNNDTNGNICWALTTPGVTLWGAFCAYLTTISEAVSIVIPILQMKKLRPREVK